MQFLRMHERLTNESRRGFLNAHVQPFLCPTAQPPTRARRTLNSIKVMCSLGVYLRVCGAAVSKRVEPLVVCRVLNKFTGKDGD
jgi:hypothetical protein